MSKSKKQQDVTALKSEKKVRAQVAKANRNNWRTVSSKNQTKSGHILTDAKVKNINNYVSYAATEEVPYLLSSYSQYQDLISPKNAKQIVDRVSNELNQKDDKVIDEVYKSVKQKEEDFIKNSEIVKRLKATSASQIAKEFNSLKGEDGKSVKDLIVKLTTDVRQGFYFFLDDFTKSETFLNQLKDMMGLTNTPLDYQTARSGNVITTNYKMQDKERIEDVYNSLILFLDSVQANEELGKKDLQGLSQALTYVSVVTLRMKEESNKIGLNQVQFDNLATKIQDIVAKYKSDPAMKVMKNLYGEGFVGEVMLVTGFQSILDTTYNVKGDNPEELVDKLMIKAVSGEKDVHNKTIDSVITFENTEKDMKLGVDQKIIGTVKQREHGLIYQTKMEIDFAESAMGLVTGRELSPSTKKLYRSYLLNKSLTGHSFTPQERQFLLFNMLNNKETFNHKFLADGDKADVEGYPILVNINGVFSPFSEVIKQMRNPEFFHLPSKKATLSDGGGFPKSNLALYKEKVEVGKKIENKSGNRMVRGFAAEVPRAVLMANIIEKNYRRDSVSILFGIKR